MAHALCAEELPEFLDLASSARRLRRIAGGEPRARLAGCAAAMAMGVAVGRDGHPALATDVHCRDADLHRFHLQLAPGRGPDRERPAYPAHHLHDPASDRMRGYRGIPSSSKGRTMKSFFKAT